MEKIPYPPDLANAWSRVFGHAWHKDHKDFLQGLRRDPKQAITNVVNSSNPEVLVGSCATILEYVNSDNREYGYIAIPELPEGLQELSDEELYEYANRSELYGVMTHINTGRPVTSEGTTDLGDAWARVFGYAWQVNNKEFLRQLNKDPKQTINDVVNSGQPESIVEACVTILNCVNEENSEHGFLALPTPPLELRELSEEQLYGYAKQDGLYGILRVC